MEAKGFSQPAHMCFVALEKAYDCVPQYFPVGGALGIWGQMAFSYGPFNLAIVRVRALFALPAVGQSCSQSGFVTTKGILCNWF